MALPDGRYVTKRIAKFLKGSSWDALVATTPASVRYLTGYSSLNAAVVGSSPVMAVADKLGALVAIIAPASDVAMLVYQGFRPESIWCYGTFVFSGETEVAQSVHAVLERAEPHAINALNRALQTIGSQRPAVEVNALPAEVVNGLQGNPNITLTSTAWTEVREVKSAWEQEQLKQACHIAEQALVQALRVAQEGAADYDLVAEYNSQVIAHGGQPLFAVMAIAEVAALVDTGPVGKRLRVGDMIRCDVGAVYNGYCSDISRTAVLGTASAEIRERYAAILEGANAAISRIRPGVPSTEVFDEAVRGVRSNGIFDYGRTHVGHSIGLEVYDGYRLTHGNTQALKPGMVLCVETPYYEIGWGGVQVEDMVVVTRTGFELLNETSRELWEVPSCV
jgi:Xaa-Pro dipeptidase